MRSAGRHLRVTALLHQDIMGLLIIMGPVMALHPDHRLLLPDITGLRIITARDTVLRLDGRHGDGALRPAGTGSTMTGCTGIFIMADGGGHATGEATTGTRYNILSGKSGKNRKGCLSRRPFLFRHCGISYQQQSVIYRSDLCGSASITTARDSTAVRSVCRQQGAERDCTTTAKGMTMSETSRALDNPATSGTMESAPELYVLMDQLILPTQWIQP